MKQIYALTIVINSFSQWKLYFLKLQVTRSWKLIQDIHIHWNFIYLMLQRAYQLHDTINIWIEKFLTDAKIQAIWLKKNKWSLVLLVDNMLNSFYELILIVFRIINVNIHLKFRMFDALFNHLNVIKTIVHNNACTSQALVFQACKLTFNKLAKYYFKMKNKDELIYNLTMILDTLSSHTVEKQDNNNAVVDALKLAHTQKNSNVFAYMLQLIYNIHIHTAKTWLSFCAYTDRCNAVNRSIFRIFRSIYTQRNHTQSSNNALFTC